MATPNTVPVPICLQFNTFVSVYNNTTSNGVIRYTTDFTLISEQTINSNQSGPGIQTTYGLNDVKVGGWIAGTLGGFAWKIVNIVNINNTVQPPIISLELEDEENFNFSIDSLQLGGAPQPNQAHIYFELGPDGMPIFTPLYGGYLDNLLPQLPSDIISRFYMRNPNNHYVPVFQSLNGFLGGETIWLDPSDGKFKSANNTNAKYVVGIVTGVNIPISGWFTYKPYGVYYSNIQKHFKNIDLSSYTTGTFLYIATDGINKYTPIQPSDIAVPAWIYLGTDTYGQKGILYTVPSLYSGSTGSRGPTGVKGETGDLFYSTTVGKWVSNPVVVGGYETLTFSLGLSYIPANSVIVVCGSDPSIFFQGRIIGYNKGNGITQIFVTSISGGSSFPLDIYYININPLDGTEGPVGPIGIQGYTGSTGEKGDTGIIGPIGYTGPTGVTGVIGHTGKSGDLFKSQIIEKWGWGPFFMNDSTSFNVDPGLAYISGSRILISSQTLANTYIQAIVESYNVETGNIVIIVKGYTVNIMPVDYYNVSLNPIDGIQGEIGPTGPAGEQGIRGPIGEDGPQGEQGDLFKTQIIEKWGWGPFFMNDSTSFNVEPGLAYISGSRILISSQTLANTYIQAIVESYNVETGNIVIIVKGYTVNIMPVDYYNVSLNPIDGIQGETGPTGPAGEQGIRGPIGEDGPQGEQGDLFKTQIIEKWGWGPFFMNDSTSFNVDPGLAYISGSRILISSQTLANTYIQAIVESYNVETGNIVIIVKGYTVNIMPVDYYNVTLNPIDGIQGETGPTGPAGEQGIRGPIGEDGPQGEQGDLFKTQIIEKWGWGPFFMNDSTSFNVEPGLAYISGSRILISSQTLANTYIQAIVESYNVETGNIVIIVKGFTVNIMPVDYYDVTLNPIDGIQGETGPTGPAGVQGIRGPTGEAGPPGEQGDLFKTQITEIWGWGPFFMNDSTSFNVEPGLGYISGSRILISSQTLANTYIQAIVESYNVETGNIVIIVKGFTVNIMPVDYYDVTLNPIDGLPGQGVPTGGATGYVLTKNSATNYDTAWKRGDAFFDMTALAPYFVSGSPADLQTAIVRMASLLSNMNSGPIP